MRKSCDGEVEEKNGENSSPLTSLPIDRLNGNQLPMLFDFWCSPVLYCQHHHGSHL